MRENHHSAPHLSKFSVQPPSLVVGHHLVYNIALDHVELPDPLCIAGLQKASIFKSLQVAPDLTPTLQDQMLIRCVRGYEVIDI